MNREWLKEDSVCLAMGDAVALNLMFENKRDHQLFFELWDKYLGGMASLLNYHLSPTGWVLLFRTKDKEQIINAYHQLRNKSRKAKIKSTLEDTTRILSEHFRILLSQFVRRSNQASQRKGTKVLERFHKYVLKASSDYTWIFNQMTRKYRKKAQKNKKYQADESQYDIQKEMSEKSVWKVAVRMYYGLERGFRERFGVELVRPNSDVLRKILPNSKPPKIPHRYT